MSTQSNPQTPVVNQAVTGGASTVTSSSTSSTSAIGGEAATTTSLVSLPTFEAGEFEWIEKNGIENLKARVSTADTLAKEAATTLTVLLAGIGGSLAYAIKLLDPNNSIVVATAGLNPTVSGNIEATTLAAAAVCLWLTLLAIALVLMCMMFFSIPAVYNQPGRLLKRQAENETFDTWRFYELENIEERIKRAVKRNRRMAIKLNAIRIAATLTPIVAFISTILPKAVWIWIINLV